MARFDHIGRAIRALRVERHWSQRDLARRARTTSALLSSYERGRKLPSLPSLGRLLDALGADLHQLEDQLDRLNERGPKHAAAGAPARAVPGVDRARFFGLQAVPRGFEQPLAEMVPGLQSAALPVGEKMLDDGARLRRR
jgi:transcriptional regulator with XRE-family HTH domain